MTLKQLVILGCSSQQPTRHRNHGAYLLRWKNEGLLFDPGEGTQRQFIFADVAPTCVTKIFISHFHGDHCLGLGSMLMRLNLDKVSHPIHCFYPASGKKYFDRLRYGTMYRENISVVEHPVEKEGLVLEDATFRIEAVFLDHGVENVAWRIVERDKRRFDPVVLRQKGLHGRKIRELIEQGEVWVDNGECVLLDDVSHVEKGGVFVSILDTRYCDNALQIADQAEVLLCESTYLEEHRHLAEKHHHLTAKQAGEIARKAGVQRLILTHFSARYSDTELFVEEAQEVFPGVEVAADFKKFDLIEL